MSVSKHIKSIKKSIKFPQSIKQNTISNTESYRYVRWANLILNYIEKNVLLDIDLWTITKILEIRDINNLDKSDIINWLKFKPFTSINAEKKYLEAIKNQSVEKIIFSTHQPVINNPKSDTEYKFILSNWIFNFTNQMNKKHKFHRPKMKTYLLPSQQLKEHWNWAGSEGPHEKKRKGINIPPIFPIPDKKNPYYQINLLDYL